MIWLAWDLFGSLTQPLGATGSEGDEDDNSHGMMRTITAMVMRTEKGVLWKVASQGDLMINP